MQQNTLKEITWLKKLQYNTIKYFIDTPLVGLFSDNATNNINIPIQRVYYKTVLSEHIIRFNIMKGLQK